MKKGLKITLIVLEMFVLLALIFFTIDYSRVQKQEKPIFCILKDEVNDGGTKIYLGIGYKVIDFHTLAGFDNIKIGTWLMDYDDFKKEIIKNSNSKTEDMYKVKYEKLENIELDYDLAKMVEDRCYILMNSNTVYHIDELNNFIKNVENHVSDEIRIVQYTIEGQPILTNLEYKDNKFTLKIDSRRDGYASEEDKKITTKEYDATKYKLVKGNTPNVVTDLKTCYSLELKGIETDETVSICSYAIIKETSNGKFQIEFNTNSEKEEIIKVLTEGENDKYDYNIYSYKGTVNIVIAGERMSLRDALINNKITIEEILEKANKDARENKTIFGDVYADGGSSFYIYNDYSILKLNTLEGNKDLYIGVPSMNINDINKL